MGSLPLALRSTSTLVSLRFSVAGGCCAPCALLRCAAVGAAAVRGVILPSFIPLYTPGKRCLALDPMLDPCPCPATFLDHRVSFIIHYLFTFIFATFLSTPTQLFSLLHSPHSACASACCCSVLPLPRRSFVVFAWLTRRLLLARNVQLPVLGFL